MHIHILTLFPEMFSGPFSHSIIKRAVEDKKVSLTLHNIRDWTQDKHKTADDRPYGGGEGMVLKPEPIFAAVEETSSSLNPPPRVILLTPQGEVFNQKKALALSQLESLILICGHYEGVDERIREHLVDEELSIGNYILTGGEIPAMAVTDAITRLIPGVIEEESAQKESFSGSTLDYPQYTRPESFRGWKVPEVLLSGNHGEIEKWREKEAVKRTKKKRPDILIT